MYEVNKLTETTCLYSITVHGVIFTNVYITQMDVDFTITEEKLPAVFDVFGGPVSLTCTNKLVMKIFTYQSSREHATIAAVII